LAIIILSFFFVTWTDSNLLENQSNLYLTDLYQGLHQNLFGNNQDNEKFPIPVLFEVEADLVSLNDGNCLTSNVRVYATYGGLNRFLVASDNVEVCGDKNLETNSNNTNSRKNCNGHLPDGNYVFENNIEFEYCLLEILKANDLIYNLYRKEVSKFNL